MNQIPIPASLKTPADITNPSLKRLNESYESKIAKGQIQVTRQANTSRLRASENYDKVMKAKKLAEAEREKKELERKLEYLNKSIQSIKEYDFSSGKVASTEQSPNPKPSLSPPKTMDELRKKVRQYQNELNRKRQLAKKRKIQAQELQRKAQEKEEESKKTERKQKIFENMQKIKKRIQDRESLIKQQSQEYRRVIHHKSLHQKLEESFEKKQASMLEQRKKKLADIRNLHRPISLSEIADHQKTFMEVLKEKQSMRERERRINNSGQEYRVSYRSPTHMKMAQGDKQPKEDESRIKADKVRQFSQHVRDNFVPAIDERKRESLEKLLEEERLRKERENSKQQQQKQRVEEIRSKGLRYLEQIKDLPKRKNSSGQTSPVPQRIQYKNYLTHTQRTSGSAWSNILSGSQDKKQKALRLKAEAEKLQGGLKMRQKKARLLKEDPGEIDQQYYDMIKAKLDLLQI